MKIAKEFRWEMGHRLLEHKGKCYNLHGHSYRLMVEFSGDVSKNGMLIDYFDVKKIVGPIVDELDHCIVVNKNDTELLNALKNLRSNYVLLDYESTAENLCTYFLTKISETLLPDNIEQIMVKVFETENTYAMESLKIKGK